LQGRLEELEARVAELEQFKEENALLRAALATSRKNWRPSPDAQLALNPHRAEESGLRRQSAVWMLIQ